MEIKRLQQQNKEVVEAMSKMQEQQAELALENQRIKGSVWLRALLGCLLQVRSWR